MIDISSTKLPSLAEIRASAQREVYLSSLQSFVRGAWSIVEPRKPLKWNWHLDAECDVLSQVESGTLKRVIFNVPPGTTKSLLISVMWPAYLWAKYAHYRFLTASYTIDNTIRDNGRMRDIVRSKWYRSIFWSNPLITLEKEGEEKLTNSAKGFRIATSVGGVGTGEHPDIFIIDDPLKAQDRNSDKALEKCIAWMKDTVSTRIALDPALILVMQRLHLKDPSGYLLEKGGWEHVCFPMRYESAKSKSVSFDSRNIPDPRDKRTRDGELLWPEQFPEAKVRQEELDLGPFGAAGQLQQNPIPEGGGLFKREWFNVVSTIPVGTVFSRGWDIAETDAQENKPDANWTAGVKVGRTPQGRFIVASVIKVKSTLVDGLIKATAKMDGKNCSIREGSGSGKATIRSRALLLAGYDYAASPEHESKVSRIKPFRAQTEAGNVDVLAAEWTEDYLSEMCAFPVGKFDDVVDGTGNAFNALVEVELDAPQEIDVTWGR